MTVHSFVFNGFQENTYLLVDDNKKGVLVDPGCYSRNEEAELVDFIREEEIDLLAILGTHAHIDHVLGNNMVMEKFKVPYYLHQDDLATLKAVPNYAHVYGFEGYKPSPSPTNILKGGEVLTFGEMTFDVIHAPGHAPGHVVYYSKTHKLLVNGDVLFKGSFGRTDLPGGSMKVLKETIIKKLFSLPEDVVVLTGHGEPTTIGEEKHTNYILQA
jgi:hydroxyacylglutathione hydrolase